MPSNMGKYNIHLIKNYSLRFLYYFSAKLYYSDNYYSNLMRHIYLLGLLFCCGLTAIQAQNRAHSEKFEQLKEEWRSPNVYRAASGAPGHEYWQQRADYDIAITLDDQNRSISGTETITYTNNSPDVLTYLWVQLDQNVRAQDSNTPKVETSRMREVMQYWSWRNILEQVPNFDGGFKIDYVRQDNGVDLSYTINKTMMVIDLPKPLKPGETFAFSTAWSYKINNRLLQGGRSGYEYFEEDDNCLYTIAQFYPRMCVYNDIDGWQNKQFLGGGEFTVGFGDFKVSITAPSDHVIASTGKLQNPNDVLTETQISRWEEAKTAKEPVMIITQEEAEKNEKKRAKDTKTWVFEAENVRDFAFASSRKFIWDAMGVDVGGKNVMAVSYYPKEGNPLWEKYSTKAVAHTLKTYSHFTFDYPYHKAISVHSARIGMEYPMICFNFGRPRKDGSYSDRVKNSMIMVIIHEVGHNYFPMIVNSDERQWTWMDEGLNSFLQFLAEKEWKEKYDPEYEYTAGEPWQIVDYMKMDKSVLSPIMTNSEQIQNFGSNAYDKPATALNILRETVMGKDLFDRAFKEYSRRWMFKHPTPEDFFRTMEDASAVDLDWFWKGWFYSVDHCDMALDVEWYKMGEKKEESEEDDTDKKKNKDKKKKKKDDEEVKPVEDKKLIKEFTTRLPDEESEKFIAGLNFYEINVENIGGLVMPVLLTFKYTDGSSEEIHLPAEIWRKGDQKISKVFPRAKELEAVFLDPNNATADTDLSNNSWPKQQEESKFEKMKQD